MSEGRMSWFSERGGTMGQMVQVDARLYSAGDSQVMVSVEDDGALGGLSFVWISLKSAKSLHRALGTMIREVERAIREEEAQ